ARDALAAILAEYSGFVADGPTEAEIAPLKTIFVNRMNEALSRASSLAATLIMPTAFGFPDDYLATYEARVRAIDIPAINQDIRAKLPQQPLTVVVVAPSAAGFEADCVIK